MSDDRVDRLIASHEVMANAINRLVQVLERKERKKATPRAARARRTSTRTADVTPRAEAMAKAALARVGVKG